MATYLMNKSFAVNNLAQDTRQGNLYQTRLKPSLRPMLLDPVREKERLEAELISALEY